VRTLAGALELFPAIKLEIMLAGPKGAALIIGVCRSIRGGTQGRTSPQGIDIIKPTEPPTNLVGVLPVTPAFSLQEVVITNSKLWIIQVEVSIGTCCVIFISFGQLPELTGTF